MWGWKTLEMRLPYTVGDEALKTSLMAQGFGLFGEHEGVSFFKKPNPPATIELAVTRAEGGTCLQMRYGSFVLFDTGDLQRQLDAVVARLPASQVQA